MQNKSVRKWVFSGYRDRFQIFQGFFMKDVFPTGMSFIFDKNLNLHGPFAFLGDLGSILPNPGKKERMKNGLLRIERGIPFRSSGPAVAAFGTFRRET
jgi:hypothetical protein